MSRDDNSDSPRASSFDPDKLRLSERQIDRGIKDLGSSLSTQKDRDGQERFWGFKVSKTAAFAINSLYDNFILPFTGEGAKAIYKGVNQLAKASERTSGYAHEIASGVTLAARIGAVVAKPVAEFVSINREHYSERAELYAKVKDAIEGTPANYETNEVVATAFNRINNQWSRDVTRKVPDLIKTGLQATMAYSEHQADMAKRVGASVKVDASASKASGPTVDTEREALNTRVNEMKARGDAPELIALEIEEYKKKKGMIVAKDDDAGLGVLKPNLSGILGVGTELAKVAVDEYTEGSVGSKDNAWEKIQLLKQYLDQIPPGHKMRADDIKVGSTKLKKFLVEIFQQNEVDHGRGRMGEALVEQLMPAIDKIADHLADTTMDANALVHLVGDHKIIIHQGEARIFASEKKVDAALSTVVGVNTVKSTIDPQEFFSNFADPALARSVIKSNLQTLEGKERSVFIATFPDELLKEAGLGKEAIIAARQEAHSFIYDVVTADTIELAQNDPDKLKELGLSKTEIAAIKELGDDIQRGRLEEVKRAVDGADRTVMTAISKATLQQQIDEGAAPEAGQKVWSEVVRKGGSIQEKLENGEFKPRKTTERFSEREELKASRSKPDHHSRDHDDATRSMSAREREIHRRGKQNNEPHEGIGAV